MTDEEILETIGRVVEREIGAKITARMDTTANDVGGWDSMAHARVVFGLEKAYGIDIDMGRAFAAANVGELVVLIRESLPTGG